MKKRSEVLISVEELSKIIHVGPQQIRYGMRSGRLPIGWAIENDKGHWSYHIVIAKLFKFFRMTTEELMNELEEIRKVA